MRRIILLLHLFILIASISFAEMTIYFKDGTSRQVHKIVFKGENAELFVTDGSILQVPVDRIDLLSSGIGAPVGTYGKTGVSGQRRFKGNQPTASADPSRQNEFRQEWERSEQTAIAINDVGAIRAGDVVKIVARSGASGSQSTTPEPQPRSWSRSASKPVDPRFKDAAYVILYKNADGTFAKQIFDAVAFENNFNRPEKKSQPKPDYSPAPLGMPEQPSDMPSTTTTPEAGDSTTPGKLEDTAASPLKTITPADESSSRKFVWLAVAVALLATAAIAVLLMRRQRKPWIDTSKFRSYEDDLREFEIAIWLKNGKTAEQLLEICLKKFYGDQPAALDCATKLAKGSPKTAVFSAITKQSSRSNEEAEEIYQELQNRISAIKSLIQDVSRRTGVQPVKTVLPSSAPSAPRQAPVAAARVVSTPPPSAPSVISISMPAGTNTESSPVPAGDGRTPQLPGYAGTVLAHLAFLTTKQD